MALVLVLAEFDRAVGQAAALVKSRTHLSSSAILH
jgi:hypothetical protein